MAGETDLRRTFYLFGSMALVGGLLYWARPVMIPVTIAVLATFVLAPVASYMERKGLPRFAACTIAVLGVAILLLGIVQVFAQQADALGSELPAYKTQLSQKITDLRQAATNSRVADFIDFINGIGKTEDGDNQPFEPKSEPGAARMEVPWIPVLQSLAMTLAEFVLNAVLVLILTLLILIRREDLRNRMIHLLGVRNLISATRALDDASHRISNFLFCQLIINIGFGVVVAIGLYFIGIPYAYIWGALAALLRYVPFLGGCISAAFPLLASAVMPDWTPFLLTAAFFVIIEILQANLVEPLVFGHSIGVSGAGQLIAALFWACLWGPVGLILSTPLTACLCVLGRHFPALHFFSTLMGDDEFVEKPIAFYQRLLAGDSSEASDLVESYMKDNLAPQSVDAILIPALLSAKSDHKTGELTKDDQLSIMDTVREIFHDVVAPFEKEHRAIAAPEDVAGTNVLLLEFPFNDEIDDLIAEMLKNSVTLDASLWTSESLKDSRLDGISRPEEREPAVILLATSAKRNLARVRGACKAVRKMFPDATIVVGCWSLENEADALRSRLNAAGANFVCTTFQEAREFIESKAHEVTTERSLAPAVV